MMDMTTTSSRNTAVLAAISWIAAIVLMQVPLITDTFRLVRLFSREPFYGGNTHGTIAFVAGTLAITFVGLAAAGFLAVGSSWARPFLVSIFGFTAVWAGLFGLISLVEYGESDLPIVLRTIGAALTLVAIVLSCIPPTNRFLRDRRAARLRRQVPEVFEAEGF